MLHISFLHELRWRCQKVHVVETQRYLESRGNETTMVWAARCLHSVPAGKDRHAAASFACEGPAACTQPLMSESNWTRHGCGLFFPQPEKQCQVQSCLEAVTTLSIVLCPAGPRSLTLSVREHMKSEGLWLKAGACCHWVESGNSPLSSFFFFLITAWWLQNLWTFGKCQKLLQLTVWFQGLLGQLIGGERNK